jgi:hypothetical protein
MAGLISARCARRIERGVTFPPRHLCILPCSKAITKDRDPQVCFLYKPRSFSLRILPPEQNRAFDYLRTIDNIVFYRPPLALTGRPPRLPGAVTGSNAPGGPIASISGGQTASQLNQQSGISKYQINKSRDISDLSQKSHTLDRRYRNNTVQEQGKCQDFPPESLHLTFIIEKTRHQYEIPQKATTITTSRRYISSCQAYGKRAC